MAVSQLNEWTNIQYADLPEKENTSISKYYLQITIVR